MKILKLRIKNLNSLRGTFNIDFEKAPFADTTLFLISGNTGAGKTTILDALTLGLYGRIARYEDNNIKKKVEQVLSYGCKDSYAEVEFRAKGQVYVAKWSIRTTRTGNIEAAKRELAQLQTDGRTQILATKVKEVNEAVTALMGGLDFNRFTRSVLLAQGEFAAFLKGTEDRSEILERITGTDHYTAISKGAYERHKEAERALSELAKRMDEVQLLTAEEEAQLEEEQGGKVKEAKALAIQTQDWREQIFWLAECEKVVITLRKNQEELQVLLNQREAAQKDFKRKERHDQALVLKPDYDKLLDISKESEEVGTDLKKQGGDLEKEEGLLKELMSQESEAAKTHEQQGLKYKEQLALCQWVSQVDQQLYLEKGQLGKTKAKGIELAERIKSFQQQLEAKDQQKKKGDLQKGKIQEWLKEHSLFSQLVEEDSLLDALKEDKEKYNIAKNQLRQVQKHLKEQKEQQEQAQKSLEQDKKRKAQLSLERKASKQALTILKKQFLVLASYDVVDSPAVLERHLEKKQLLKQQLIQLRDYQSRATILKNEQLQVVEEKDQLLVQEVALEKSLKVLGEQEQALEKDMRYKELILTEQRQKADFKSHRGNLKEGAECPLCFSTEQPFRQQDFEVDELIALATRDFEQVRKQVEEIRQERQEKELDKQSKSVGAEQLSRRVKQIAKELQSIEEQILRVNTLLGEEIIKSQQDIAVLENTIKEIQDGIKQAYALKETIAKEEQESIALEERVAVLEARILKGKALIEKDEEDAAQHRERQATSFEAIDEKLRIFNIVLDTEGEQLDRILENLGEEKRNQQRALETLQNRQQEAALFQKEIEGLNTQLKDLDRERSLVRKEYLEQLDGVKKLEEERKAKFGDKNPKIVQEEEERFLQKCQDSLQAIGALTRKKQTEVVQLEAEVKALDKRRYELDQAFMKQNEQLQTACLAQGIEEREDLFNLFLSDEEYNEIKEKQAWLHERITLTSEQENQNKQALSLLQEKDLTQETTETLTKKLEENKLYYDGLMQRMGEIKQQLDSNQQQLARYQAFEKQRLAAKVELKKWAELNKLIGSHNGKKFRTFAQGITLNKLIVLANKHMRVFNNGRYQLQKSKEDSLEINIIDAHQANNQRTLMTLSGGESFLASLALALGLSDLAGGDSRIESLFIDEGFGTLDQNTMEVALGALQSLHVTGKTIGLISHIQQLKQKISAQIQVVKKGGGFSEIKTVEV